MSRPRYIWWSYVQGMVRKYPERAAALGELQTVGMTARYGTEPAGGSPGRATEAVALRELPPLEQREFDAVRKTLDYIATLPDGAIRMEIVRMVYWDRTHKLHGAALKVGISEVTAKRWNAAFLRWVACNFGLLDDKLILHGQKGAI